MKIEFAIFNWLIRINETTHENTYHRRLGLYRLESLGVSAEARA